jgi:hypothetical protein
MNDALEENPIRHPIRFKIFLVSLVPTLALLAAALINNQYLKALGDSAEQILSKNYKSIRAAQEARKALEEIRNPLLEQVSRHSGRTLDPRASLVKLAANLRLCQENITEAGEREWIDRLMESYAIYEPLAVSLNTSDVRAWPDNRLTAFLTLTARMVMWIDALVAINENAMERAEQETRLLAGRAQRNAALFFGIIITGILALSYFFSYRIAKPIMTLARQLSDPREGKGIYPMVQSRTRDEIGYLSHCFNRLFERLKRYDQKRDEILAQEREKVRHGEEAKGRFIAEISH